MKTRMYVTFYVRKKDNQEEGTIYCRVTVNGKAKNFSLNESIALSKWDAKCNRCIGSSKAANDGNKEIDAVRSALTEIRQEFIMLRKPLTLDAIMNTYNCVDERAHTVVSSFEYHNREMEKLVGKKYSASTLERYKTAFQHVRQFMREEYGVEDIPLVELKTLKYTYFENNSLERVRDVFLFACFSGFAYSELFKLTHKNIITDNDGMKWLEAKRTKTDIVEKVLLLEEAERIINKYLNDPVCAEKGKLLPILSNQKYNTYLKIVATMCGINKDISTHRARHSFATSVALANGVSIENVAKMLGHSNTNMTRHYARVLDKSIKRDMDLVNGKFTNQSTGI